MQKLMLAVDGSPCSVRAAKFLVQMVRGLPAPEVHVVNVQPPIVAGEISAVVNIEMATRIHELAGRKALGSVRGVLDKAKLAHTEHLLEGEPAHAIAGFAKESGIDAIVMGTRGLGLIQGLLLGSIATKVLHLVDVPVTLVK